MLIKAHNQNLIYNTIWNKDDIIENLSYNLAEHKNIKSLAKIEITKNFIRPQIPKYQLSLKILVIQLNTKNQIKF